jgi:hypothetical protein
MEVGWMIRNPKLYAAPFRIDHKAKSGYWGEGWRTIGPGYFTQQLAVPWQSDFYHCAGSLVEPEYTVYHAWWPGHHPNEVRRKKGKEGEAVDWFRAGSKDGWDIRRELDESEDGEQDTIQYRRKMLENWNRLGFVVRDGNAYVEDERATGEFS